MKASHLHHVLALAIGLGPLLVACESNVTGGGASGGAASTGSTASATGASGSGTGSTSGSGASTGSTATGTGTSVTTSTSASASTADTTVAASSSSSGDPCAGIDLTSDADNCGVCGRACNTPLFQGAACVAGVCDPATENLGLVNVRNVRVDRSTGNLFVVHDIAATLSRLGPGVAIASAPTGLDIPTFTTLAANDDVAYLGYSAVVSGAALLGDDWTVAGGPAPLGPTSQTGIPFVEVIGGEVYWSADLCVRRNVAAPVDVACFGGTNPSYIPLAMVPHPTDPSRAFVFTQNSFGTQGPIVPIHLDTLATDPPLASFPQPQVTQDHEHSFVSDSSGEHLYVFAYSVVDGTQIHRIDVATGATTALLTLGVGTQLLAWLRDGQTIYWAYATPSASGFDVSIERAPEAALNGLALLQPQIVARFEHTSGFLPIAVGFDQDAAGLYFVHDYTLHRLTK